MIDTPQTRSRLARAVVDLEARGLLERPLAAMALIDLDSDVGLLVDASLVHAAFVAAGMAPTPFGLVVAA